MQIWREICKEPIKAQCGPCSPSLVPMVLEGNRTGSEDSLALRVQDDNLPEQMEAQEPSLEEE